MTYTLYSDKDTTFEAKVNVSNASLKNSIARLIVETADMNLIFNGKIVKDTCIIPIKKLAGILEENTKGKAKLEIIVEDTYFKPWESECVVDRHTKVEINEVKNTVSTKPLVEVKVQEQSTPNKVDNYNKAIFELKYVIDKMKPVTKKDKITVLNEFLKANSNYKVFKKELIKEAFTRK